MGRKTSEELAQAIEDWYVDRGIKRREAEERASKIVLRDQIAAKLPDLSEDDAAAVVYLFDRWQVGIAYSINDVVQYKGGAFKVLQAHTSQADWTPDTAASLFTPLRNTGQGGGAPDEWVQPVGGHDSYSIGDRVTFNGSVYESLINGNAHSPSAYPAGWKLVE